VRPELYALAPGSRYGSRAGKASLALEMHVDFGADGPRAEAGRVPERSA
jgi:hypothetical protein